MLQRDGQPIDRQLSLFGRDDGSYERVARGA